MTRRLYHTLPVVQLLIGVVTAVCIIKCSAFGRSQEPPDGAVETDVSTIHYLLDGLKAKREEIRSGVFRAYGRVIQTPTGRGKGIPLEGDVELFSAFDHDKAYVRFDRTEPTLIWLPKDELGKVNSREGLVPEVRLRTGMFISRPDQVVTWVKPLELTPSIGEGIAIGVFPPGSPPPSMIRPFDVRTTGLSMYGDFVRGIEFDNVMSILLRADWDTVEHESGGVYRLERPMGLGSARLMLWIDEDQGYSPIRFDVFYKSQNTIHTQRMIAKSTLTSIQINNVWVPRTLSIEDYQSTSYEVRKYDLAFEWELVNESVPDDYFDVQKLDVPPDVPMFDNRLGRPIRVARELVTEDNTADRRWIFVISALLGSIVIALLFGAVIRWYYRGTT